MAKYRITAPDGTVYDVEGEGSEQDALNHIQQQHSAKAAQAAPATAQPPAPVASSSQAQGPGMLGRIAQGVADLPSVLFGQKGTDAMTAMNADRRARLPIQMGIVDTGNRIMTNALTGIFDLGGTVGNAIKHTIAPNASREWDAPNLGMTIREAQGMPELPEDASGARRIAEGAASALAGGGLAGVRQGVMPLINRGIGVTADTVGSEVAADLAQQAGWGELGTIIAALGGGGARSVVQPLAGSAVNKTLGSRGGGETFDAMMRATGHEPTAGMVGGPFIGGAEKALGSVPIVGAPVEIARNNALTRLQGAVEEGATALNNGRPFPDTGHAPRVADAGDLMVDAARREADLRRFGAKEAMREVYDPVADAPAPAQGVVNSFLELADQTGSQGSEAALRSRADYVRSKFRRGPTIPGTPVYNVNPVPPAPSGVTNPGNLPAVPGSNFGLQGPRFDYDATYSHTTPGTPGPVIPEVTIRQLKDVRSDLGRQADTAAPLTGRDFDTAYGVVTDALRGAVDEAHGTPGTFDRANDVYREAMRKGGPVDRLTKIGGGEAPRGNQVRDPMPADQAGRVLERGLQSPARLMPFANNVADSAAGPVMGAFVRAIGSPATAGADYTFDPVRFSNKWGPANPRAKEVVTRNAPDTLGTFNDVATAGRNYNLPPMSQGLSRALGWLGTMLGSGVGGAVGASGGIIPAVIGGAVPLTAAMGLESGPMVRALAGRHTRLGQNIQDMAPAIAQYLQTVGQTPR
jgi:hypothetical protein